ncbi:MAG: HAD family hydrolase [Bacteroidales bacterium]|nr:HAD family hydrolase [Bacteroidales bacterium]
MSILDKKVIIWDWNGTLLDDVNICVACINELLKNRELTVLSLDRYRELFTFPVIEYYRAAGFDFSKEEFEKPAMEFIDLYHTHLHKAALFEQTRSILTHFSQNGYRQLVLSAMEQKMLISSLKSNDILHFFDHVFGLDDHYASGKIEAGQRLIDHLGMSPGDMVLIGDTLHDKEVAETLGINVVLVANGHQSKARLQASGHDLIVDSLAELPKFFNR